MSKPSSSSLGLTRRGENKSTNIGTNKTIGLSVNGGAKITVETTAGGVFSFTGIVVSANDTIALFIDDEGAEEATLISQAIDGTTDITGLEMYTNKVVLRHETAGPMSNSLLDTADGCGDDDIKYSGTTTITFATGFELWIDNVGSGKNYTPGNPVVADDIEIRSGATFSPGANAVAINGSYLNSGTLTTSGTITFSAGSGGKTLAGTMTGASSFANLTFDNASGAWALGNSLTVTQTLTLTSGTVSIADNNYVLNATNAVVSGGSLSVASQSIVRSKLAVSGAFSQSGGTVSFGYRSEITVGSFSLSSGTFTLLYGYTNISTMICGGNFSVSGGTFENKTGGVSASAAKVYVFGDVTISAGTVNIENYGEFRLAAGFSLSGTGTFTMSGANSKLFVSGNCDMSAGTTTISGGAIYFQGNSATFTPSSSTYANIYFAKTAGQTTTIAGNITTSGYFEVTSGAINPQTYTVTLTGTATHLDLGGQNLYDVVIDGSISVADSSGGATHSLTVNTTKTLTLNTGRTFTMASGATTTISGTGSIIGSGTLTLVDGAGTNLGLDGTIRCITRFQTISSNVVIPSRTYAGYIQVYNASSTNRTAVMGTATGQTLTVGNSLGFFDLGRIIVTADGTGGIMLDGATYDPTVNVINASEEGAGSSGSIYFSGSGTGTRTIRAGDGTWSIKGHLNLTGGTLEAGNSTFVMNGTGSNIQTITSAGNSFNNLTLANTTVGGTTFIDGATVNGTFTDTTAPSKIVFNSGSTYNFNTVNIAGSAGQLVTLAPSGATNWTFNPSTVTGVSYVTVSKSTNNGAEFCATYSTDGGDNIGWSISAADSCQTVAPTDVAVSGIDSTYFDVTWSDQSADETGFKVFVSTVPNADCSLATYPESPDYTTGAGIETQQVTGKSINTQYCAKVMATGPNGDSDPAYAAAAKYTLANTPSVPTVAGDYSVVDGYHADVTINANNNPAGTNYWIQYSTNGTDFSDPASMAWQTDTSYKLTGLDPSTQYWFKVKAKNGDNTETSYSSAGADVTPPAAPTSPNTSNICATTASTSWAASTGADKYTFSYGTDTNATNLGTTSNITDTQHDMSNLVEGTKYYWKVSATSNANGTGAYSAIENFTATTCVAPIAPNDFNGAATSSTQINWSWGNTTGESGWKVQDENHATLETLPADTLSWNETPLSVNTAYTRHVNVYNDFGSNDSNQKTVYTLANVPSAPTVSAVASGIKIIINKNSNPEANTRYAIYNQTESKYVKHADGSLQADPDWQLYADWGGASGFVNTGLLPNVTNSYQVKAENGDSIATGLSDASSAYTLANVPSAPTVNATSTSSLTVIVNQNSNPAATSFAIRETATGKYVQADGTLGASAVWQDYATWGGAAGIVVTGLSPNNQSTFEVKAKNGDNVETDMSSVASKYTLANTPLAPTVSTVSANAIKIVVKQNSNPSGTRYAIYNQTAGKYVRHSDGTLQNDADWQLYADWGGASGFNNTGLDSGTSYSYQVKAENGDDVATEFSDVASTKTSYPTVGFASGTASASISQAANTIAINLSNASGTDASVDYAVTGGTAVAGVDYTFVDGTANIAHGQTRVNANLTLINNHLVGSNKTIVFTLSNPVNTSLGATDTLTFTIINDNPAPSGSFTINGGATKTNSRDLSLALTYSLATQMKISTDPDFAGAAYEAVASSKTYTLPDSDGAYTVYLKYKDQYGNESTRYSKSITLDRTAPSAPTNLSAQGGNRTISLSWENPSDSDFTYARVYRGTVAGFAKGDADKTFDVYKPGSTYVDSDVVNNRNYYYKVAAFDDAGNESELSSEANARADSDNPTTPGKPSITQQTQTNDGKTYTTIKDLDFVWSASEDVNSGLGGYYLTIATASGSNDVLNAQEIAPTQTTFRYSFAKGGQYFIRVYATDNKGNRSADSDEYILYIDDSAPTEPSEVLMYDASDRSNNIFASAISWKSSTDDISGLKGYVVSRDGTALSLNDKGVTEGVVTDEATGYSFYFDVVGADSKVSYTVKAIDNAGNETGAISSALAGTAMASTTGQKEGSQEMTLPSTVIGEGTLAITDVKVTPSDVISDKTQAQVTWNTGVPATSQVFYGTSTDYQLKTELDTGLNSSHTVVLPDLKTGTTYHVKVASKDKSGKEISSSDQTFSTGVKTKDKTILEMIAQSLSEAFIRIWQSVTNTFNFKASAADKQDINTLSVVDISTETQPGYAIYWPAGKGLVTVERSGAGTVGSTDQNYFLDFSAKEKGSYTYQVSGMSATVSDELSGKSTISDIKISSGAVSKDEASVILYFKTDKLAKSQVVYGANGALDQKTAPNEALNQSHTVLIEKLKPDTSYSFKISVTDKSGQNSTESSVQVFATGKSLADQTLLEIIIQALQQAFQGFDKWIKT